MDMTAFVSLFVKFGPTIVSLIDAIPTIQNIVTEFVSNDAITQKIQKTFPSLAPIMEAIGATLFPSAAPGLHIAAVAMATFSPSTVVWIQQGCNQLLNPSPNLVADGVAGPLTQAAVKRLQEQYGLTVDGVPGQVTQALITALLNKLSVAPTPVAAPVAPATPAA